MTKAIFLDRDGTINAEKNYLHKIEDFEFLPGVIEALQRFQEMGYLLIVVTNQSGIARGYYTEADFEVLNKWMIKMLEMQGVHITKVYYCPHLPDAIIEKYRKDCECRKPALGMFQEAIDEYQIDLSRSYAIGDKLRDLAICEQTDCKGYLIGLNEEKSVISGVESGKYKGVMYKETLFQCYEDIKMEADV